VHDPQTVAFDIKRPWRDKPREGDKIWPKGYRPPLITIWHVDPTEDSCGWHTPPISADDYAKARKIGEGDYVFVLGKHGFKMTPYELIFCAWQAINGQMHGRRDLTVDELVYMQNLASNPADNLRWGVAEFPTTTSGPMPTIDTPEKLGEFYATILRCYRRHHRPWWRHPRWHFWHFKLQVHPWQQFRRWAFTRCAACGGRFAYGESPVGFQWHKPKTRWFRSEADAYHSSCANKVRPGCTP
jgi:hypothetical protein